MVTNIPVLPDVLQPGLRLVICGTAAETVSAAIGLYYAGAGNKFWSVLHEVGLTKTELRPREYAVLLHNGIGLTDMAKHACGPDADLPSGCFDVGTLRSRLEECQPRALGFNDKKAASVFFGVRTSKLFYGRQLSSIGLTLIYVPPSTSGAGSRYWHIEPWHEMAREVQ
jgi:TDG/mug DNA glycosylase family protein